MDLKQWQNFGANPVQPFLLLVNAAQITRISTFPEISHQPLENAN
jgi:hypothetical protein